jgi:hypothetical protein
MIIGIQECSIGNEVAGINWVETKIFKKSDTLQDVSDWSKDIRGCKGKLILSEPQNSEENFNSTPADKQQAEHSVLLDNLLLRMELLSEKYKFNVDDYNEYTNAKQHIC